MPSKKKPADITQADLRTAFALLRLKIRVADEDLQLRAIYEFRRELEGLWHEAIDRSAQANMNSFETQQQLIEERIPTWTAQPPLIS